MWYQLGTTKAHIALTTIMVSETIFGKGIILKNSDIIGPYYIPWI